MWISNSDIAGIFYVFANADPSKVTINFIHIAITLLKEIKNGLVKKIFLNLLTIIQGHKGVTCFIVERDQEGFTVAKKEDKLGMKASGTCVLHFDNVKVSKINNEFNLFIQ